MKPKARTVELVRGSYQPTKAELAEAFSLAIPGETVEEHRWTFWPELSQNPSM